MSTKDIANEASDATDALLVLSEAGKMAAKKRKKEIKAARKRQAQIAYAARLAARAEQDKIDEAQEVLTQIDPDLSDTPEPVVKSTPTPDPVAPVVAESEPKVVEKVVDLNPELKAENEALRKETAELKAQLDEKVEEVPTPEPVVAPVVAPEPETKVDLDPLNEPPPAPSDVDPSNWGVPSWILALLGLVLGWHFVGEPLSDWAQPHVWDWFAWLGHPVFGALGFFGGGWIGQSLVRLWEKNRTRPAEA
jgi:uncharacterized protein YdaU (DUF1376 family)